MGSAMKNQYLYFLMVAEELNINKAAQKLFISPQCLSAAIKRLEEEYHTKLFKRKPKLSLTAAGRVLEEEYRLIYQKELELQKRMRVFDENYRDTIRFGLRASRLEQNCVAEILKEFWKKYPKVRVEIVDGKTSGFEHMLEMREIDLFLGINPADIPDTKKKILLTEEFYLIIADSLLKEYFPDYPECIERFSKGVDLAEFREVPLIIPSRINRQNDSVDMFLNNYINKHKLNVRLECSGSAARALLAQNGSGASICTKYFIKTLVCNPQEVKCFPLHIETSSKLALVYHEDSAKRAYLKYFIMLFEKYFAEQE